MRGAPRLPWRPWRRFARGVCLALSLWPAGAVAQDGCDVPGSLGVAEAPFELGDLACVAYLDGTTRYPHGVLGDTVEPTRLTGVWTGDGAALELSLSLDVAHVFEDLAPRLADLNGDGRAEIITIRSHQSQGAQLAIYAPDPGAGTFELVATTPYIGRRNRWLAPIGHAADLNGDGVMEIAFIDRPHLARMLRVWAFEDGALREIATAPGLTNHRIGEDFITGGMRDCGAGPELVTADAVWAAVVVSRVTAAGEVLSEPVARFSQDAVTEALACR